MKSKICILKSRHNKTVPTGNRIYSSTSHSRTNCSMLSFRMDIWPSLRSMSSSRVSIFFLRQLTSFSRSMLVFLNCFTSSHICSFSWETFWSTLWTEVRSLMENCISWWSWEIVSSFFSICYFDDPHHCQVHKKAKVIHQGTKSIKSSKSKDTSLEKNRIMEHQLHNAGSWASHSELLLLTEKSTMSLKLQDSKLPYQSQDLIRTKATLFSWRHEVIEILLTSELINVIINCAHCDIEVTWEGKYT